MKVKRYVRGEKKSVKGKVSEVSREYKLKKAADRNGGDRYEDQDFDRDDDQKGGGFTQTIYLEQWFTRQGGKPAKKVEVIVRIIE